LQSTKWTTTHIPKPRKIQFNAPSEALVQLMMFDRSMFLKLGRVSNGYKRNLEQGIDDFCNKVENSFVGTYFEVVFFKKSFTWFRPITFLKESGLRIDRVFECEVQVPPGKTLTIACKY